MSTAIWAGICAVAMLYQTTQLLHLKVNYHLCGLVFFSTLCSYNFHFLLGILYYHKKFSANFIWQQKRRLILFFIGVIGVAIFLLPSQIHIGLIVIASFLTGLYSVPLLPFKIPTVIKNTGFFKTLLLAFTWTFVTSYLPIQQAGIDAKATLSVLILFQRFVFMFILCLLFDCRDAATDKIMGLHSLATDIQSSFIKWIMYALFGLLVIVCFLLFVNGLPLFEAFALLLTSVICFFVYLLSLQKRGYVFYYFWVDGLMVLSALLTGLASGF